MAEYKEKWENTEVLSQEETKRILALIDLLYLNEDEDKVIPS